MRYSANSSESTRPAPQTRQVSLVLEVGPSSSPFGLLVTELSRSVTLRTTGGSSRDDSDSRVAV